MFYILFITFPSKCKGNQSIAVVFRLVMCWCVFMELELTFGGNPVFTLLELILKLRYMQKTT